MKYVKQPNHRSSSPTRDIGLYRHCQRFQPKERSPQPNEEDAMVYARLRRQGLDKEKALKYCLADHCKIDASQSKHGPPQYKIFDTCFDKEKIISGWQMVGKLKEKNNEKYIRARGDDGLMQFHNREEQYKFDQLKQYFVGLSNSSKKVQLPKFQMGNGREHYFELAEYYEQIKPLKRTLITDTESFEEIIPKQKREQFRIEPKVERQPLKRTDEEKGLKQRLKALDELIDTYKEAQRPDDPSIEIILDQYHPKIEEDKTPRIDFPSMALIKDQSNFEESSASARKRCSILSYRFSKFIQSDERRKNQIFQEKLDRIVQRALGRINCQFNGTLFGKDFKNS